MEIRKVIIIINIIIYKFIIIFVKTYIVAPNFGVWIICRIFYEKSNCFWSFIGNRKRIGGEICCAGVYGCGGGKESGESAGVAEELSR
jgi:hypothetical protein